VFVAAHRGGDIVAGAIGYRTNGIVPVVGLSNAFTPAAEDAVPYWAGFVATLGGVFPGMRLVGYERGADLDVARAVGFEVLDPLRVWVRGP